MIPNELQEKLFDAWDKCASDTATPDDYKTLEAVREEVAEAQQEGGK